MTTNAPKLPFAVNRRMQQYLVLGCLSVLLLVVAWTFVNVSEESPKPAPAKKNTQVNTQIPIRGPIEEVNPEELWKATIQESLKQNEEKIGETTQTLQDLQQRLLSLNAALAEREAKLAQAPDAASVGLSGPRMPPRAGAVGNYPPGSPLGSMVTDVTPAAVPQSPPAPPTAPALPTIQFKRIEPAKNATSTESKEGASAGDLVMPSGSFFHAVILNGVDAPTGAQAQSNPQPVLLRITDMSYLPNKFRSDFRECFIIAAAYGDVAAERAYVRTETLSCIKKNGQSVEQPIKGYASGEDGKAGMRGNLITKQGQTLANALMAGIASGIGRAFVLSTTNTQTSTGLLGPQTVSNVVPGQEFQNGLATGVQGSLDRLSQYYIKLAEQTFPVVEIGAGRSVEIIVTKAVEFKGNLYD